jgi:hypothetical protein
VVFPFADVLPLSRLHNARTQALAAAVAAQESRLNGAVMEDVQAAATTAAATLAVQQHELAQAEAGVVAAKAGLVVAEAEAESEEAAARSRMEEQLAHTQQVGADTQAEADWYREATALVGELGGTVLKHLAEGSIELELTVVRDSVLCAPVLFLVANMDDV